jgi:aminomethyltransferase
MGYCLYGNEINDTTSPIAAGLGWVTSPKTGFVNSNNIRKEKTEGVPMRLVGFELIERGIPRTGHIICNEEGTPIGKVTSGTQSPTLNKPIGLGYVPLSKTTPGSTIGIEIRNKIISAKVVALPFINN